MAELFNADLTISGNTLLLYKGDATLVPHQGPERDGTVVLTLLCAPIGRHIDVRFRPSTEDAVGPFPPSEDGRFGPGTSMMRLPRSDAFFVFVTSGGRKSPIIGESTHIHGGLEVPCEKYEAHLLNALLPAENTTWDVRDYSVSIERTSAAYNLTRLSLPKYEINLTHTLTVTRKDNGVCEWNQVKLVLDRLLPFLSFVNCSPIFAPVINGYDAHGLMRSFYFEVPRRRTFPINRRTWATNLTDDCAWAWSQYLELTESPFWSNVAQRAIEWQTLSESSPSHEQAVFTVQTLLEMLAYVVLVEDTHVLSEDGYSKLPASDRITLLFGHLGQDLSLEFLRNREHKSFCSANSIENTGQLLAGIRNKLIHPTKKNRDYMDSVPNGLPDVAVDAGIQAASLTLLKAMRYTGPYFDIFEHELKRVPWRQERIDNSEP